VGAIATQLKLIRLAVVGIMVDPTAFERYEAASTLAKAARPPGEAPRDAFNEDGRHLAS